MISTTKWSSGYKTTRGKNASVSTVPHEKGHFTIILNNGSYIELNGKIARQVYQVLKKHYETK